MVVIMPITHYQDFIPDVPQVCKPGFTASSVIESVRAIFFSLISGCSFISFNISWLRVLLYIFPPPHTVYIFLVIKHFSNFKTKSVSKMYTVIRGSGVIQIFRGFHMNRLITQLGDKFIAINSKLILEIRITYGEQPPLR